MLGTIEPIRSTLYPFLSRPTLPHVLSHTPWLSSLPPLPCITVSVTSAPTSSPNCPIAQPSYVLVVEIILYIMYVSSVSMFCCLFLVPLLEMSNPLTSYTVISGSPLFSVSLVTSITWLSSVIVLTTRGHFRCTISPTPSPPSLTSSPMCPHSLVAPSGVCSVIIDASSIILLLHFLRLMASNFRYRVPIPPPERQGRAHNS
jgi:hypothetical protein